MSQKEDKGRLRELYFGAALHYYIVGRYAAIVRFALASAECRLPESLHFTECDVILGVVRARSVHKIGYGHNRDWSAA